MITTAQEYNSSLHIVNNMNPPILAQLPSAENVYNINVETREVDAPQFLSVEQDHDAETIYFIIDRYANYMDLSTTCCIIYYINANNKCHIYTVPFYDIFTYEGKMLIPWCLDKNVAEKQGTVEFSIQFFKVKNIYNEEIGQEMPVITYCLNTLPSKSKVLKGIEQPEVTEEDIDKFADWRQELLNEINQIKVRDRITWNIL